MTPASVEMPEYSVADQARWFTACATGTVEATDSEITRRATAALLATVPAEQWRMRFKMVSQSASLVGPPDVDGRRFRVQFALPQNPKSLFGVECQLDDAGLIESVDDVMPALDDITIETAPSAGLSDQTRAAIHALFERCYRRADHDYIEEALARFAFTATGRGEDGGLLGFAVGETRVLDLPRLGPQQVSLAGIGCVDPSWRRRRLFSAVESAALEASDAFDPTSTRLAAGRVAHPASMRAISYLPSVVPRPGVRPTLWQQEVGQAVARAYGVGSFDALAFVCRGQGVAAGEPVINIEDVSAEEAALFQPVDRTRGDTLLVLGWIPTAPEGWAGA